MGLRGACTAFCNIYYYFSHCLFVRNNKMDNVNDSQLFLLLLLLQLLLLSLLLLLLFLLHHSLLLLHLLLLSNSLFMQALLSIILFNSQRSSQILFITFHSHSYLFAIQFKSLFYLFCAFKFNSTILNHIIHSYP